MSERIRVAVRCRPLGDDENPKGLQIPWEVRTDSNTVANIEDKKNYSLDRVFTESVKTSQVYNEMAKKIVYSALEGKNGTIFAYGQTSTGKTYTIRGSPQNLGIIPLAMKEIFSLIKKDFSEREFLIKVSYLEIYNETIIDLLSKNFSDLKVFQGIKGDVFVDCLTSKVVSSIKDVMEQFDLGESCRHYGETEMNKESSRSHTIFQLNIESREKKSEKTAVKYSTLNLVDLAGSEREHYTKSNSGRLKEGSYINKSLLTLQRVIDRLSGEKNLLHVPFRDSKLTRILQPALGGNSLTAIVVTITLAPKFSEETKSSLLFAIRASNVTNKVVVNEIKNEESEIESLKKKLKEFEQKSNENKKSELQKNAKMENKNLLMEKIHVEKVNLLQKELEKSKKSENEWICRFKKAAENTVCNSKRIRSETDNDRRKTLCSVDALTISSLIKDENREEIFRKRLKLMQKQNEKLNDLKKCKSELLKEKLSNRINFEKIKKLENVFEETKKINLNLESENKKLQEEKKAEIDKESKQTEKNSEMDSLKEKLILLENKLNISENQKDLLSKKLAEKETEMDSIENSLNDKLILLENKLKRKESENYSNETSLKDKQILLENKLKQSETENDSNEKHLIEKLTLSESKNNLLTQKLSETSKTILTKETSSKSLEAEISELKQQFSIRETSLKSEVEKMKMNLVEKDRISFKNKNERIRMEKLLNDKEKEFKKKTEKIRILTETEEKLKLERENNNVKIAFLEEKVKLMAKTESEMLKTGKSSMKELEEELRKLREDMKELLEEKTILEEESKNIDEINEKLLVKLESLQEESEQSNKKFQNIENLNKETNKKLENIEKSFKESREEILRLKAKICSTESDLENYPTIEKENDSLKNKNRYLQEKLIEKDVKSDILDEDVKKETEKENLCKIDDLVLENESLKNQFLVLKEREKVMYQNYHDKLEEFWKKKDDRLDNHIDRTKTREDKYKKEMSKICVDYSELMVTFRDYKYEMNALREENRNWNKQKLCILDLASDFPGKDFQEKNQNINEKKALIRLKLVRIEQKHDCSTQNVLTENNVKNDDFESVIPLLDSAVVSLDKIANIDGFKNENFDFNLLWEAFRNVEKSLSATAIHFETHFLLIYKKFAKYYVKYNEEFEKNSKCSCC